MTDSVLFIATIQDERESLLLKADALKTTVCFFEPVLSEFEWDGVGGIKNARKVPPYVGGRPHYIQMRTEFGFVTKDGKDVVKFIAEHALDQLMHDLIQVVRQGWYQPRGSDEKVPISGIVRVPAERYLDWATQFHPPETYFLFSGGEVGVPFFEKDKWEWRIVNGQP